MTRQRDDRAANRPCANRPRQASRDAAHRGDGHSPAAMRLLCEPLEPRMLLAADSLAALAGGNEEVALEGDPAGAAAAHRITLTRGGYLDVSLAPAGGVPGDRQLFLRDAAGTLVATSVEGRDGVKLLQYLPQGDYDLALAAPPGAVGTCTIVGTAAEPPGPLAVGLYSGEGSPCDVALVPVDVDGHTVPQLIVANKSSAYSGLRISVFRGLPDATGAASGRFAPRATFELDRMPEAMAVADVDGDGLPDVVTTQIDFNNGASSVSWLLGTAEGGFAPGGSVSFTGYADRLAIGDIDGDGHRDVAVIPSRVVYGAANLDLVILWGTASGGFSADDMLRLPIAGTATDVAIADVDGDGRRDVVTAQAGEAAGRGRIEVRRGLPTLDPADRTGRVSAVADTIAVDGSPQRIIAHDMNRDGVADIVAACDAAPGSGSSPSGSVVVLHSVTGAGWFAAATSGIGSAPGGITAADVDGDDIVDVVVTSATDNSAAVLVGTAAGGLRGPMPYGVGKSPQGVTTGDLDGDGRPEIVTADMASGTATILWQRADGSFTDTTRDVGTLKVVAADVNGDGRMDAITLAPGAQDVSVLIGRGDGTFSQRGRYRIGGDLVSVAVGDLNGDGRLDIVAANRADPSAGVAPSTILFGRGDG